MSEKKIKAIFSEISRDHDANFVIFSDSITSNSVDILMRSLISIKSKKENLVLVLTTYGGDPDAAYRLVRFIKRKYNKLILLLYGYCKSAGTLVTLGADEIVMSDFAELGPLDVQLTKEDELVFQSGLDYIMAFNAIYENVFQTYDTTFLRLKQKSSYTITTKTAGEIASTLAMGLYAPMLANIDPIKIGEVHRALRVAEEYGKRICSQEALIEKLTSGYTSHSFAIDIKEAQKMFDNIREPNDKELQLGQELFEALRRPSEQIYVHEEVKVDNEKHNGEQNEQRQSIQSDGHRNGPSGQEGEPSNEAQNNKKPSAKGGKKQN